jgi:HK97 family phage prohead protease
MNRVFNSLTVRTIDEDKRIIEGWATTARKDRVSDIVEPLGAEFDLPIPLLLDHAHGDAVGEVEMADVTSKGIRFRARIKKISEPGLARDLVDKAWHLAKHGLRKHVSIGFQPLEWTALPDGGQRFTKWSWYELSLVSVPATQDAVIESVKHTGRRGTSPRVRARSPKFISAADRRKQRGGTIIDERKHLRRARAALARVLGEKNVPRFQTLAALERWDDEHQLKAAAKGAVWLGYEALMKAAPKRKPLPVVRLWGR